MTHTEILEPTAAYFTDKAKALARHYSEGGTLYKRKDSAPKSVKPWANGTIPESRADWYEPFMVNGGMPVWTLVLNMFSDLTGYGTGKGWHRRFSFHARNQEAAETLARSWARYQGFGPNEVAVSIATPDEIQGGLSNEFVEAFRP
jgi:hypothetical protein